METLPTITELAALVHDLQHEILQDDYRASGRDDDDRTPSMDLTIGWSPEGGWDYQTGDNSYVGCAYGHPYWAIAEIDRQSDPRDIARDLIEQLTDQLWS